MNFGPHTTEPDSHAIMDHALELGINFFDTANVYGSTTGEGTTEKIIGRWLAQGAGRREKIVLATKVYCAMDKWPNHGKLSAYHIRQSCEDSLRRLQTDCIDLYQMHHVDRETPFDEIWQAMEILVQQGKVLYVGSSNFAGWHVAHACESAKARNFLGLVSEQCIYNLAKRQVELELLPACRHYGLAVIPWSPLWGGLFASGPSDPVTARRANELVTNRAAQYKTQLDQYEQLCHQIGSTVADVALAFLLANPVVTAPIIGPRTLEQLTSALRALQLNLDAPTLKKLDEIWPGPGREAPEAWAW
jgi:aryl-alcohol dehydrogenase-like predicted oxidoreductase